MTARDALAGLRDRLRAGEDAAAREVFERFTCRLIVLARHQVGALVRHRVDPEDAVQSAFKSFFLRHWDGELRVENWDGLWGLLTLLTLRKCADRVAYFRAGKGDVQPEAAATPGLGEDDAWRQGIDREPTPMEAAMLHETVEELHRGLPAAKRPILELSLQGYTAREISEQLGRAERSVRRLREQIRGRLERLLQEA